MAITALPTPPSSSSPSNFDTRADAFLGALPTFVTEANALQTDVNTKQGTATTAATTATTQAATATAQAVLAAASAAAAAASASATLWVSGTNYTAGAVVYSPTNYATYRTTTSGTSSTDPAADTTGRWVSAMLPSAEAIGLPSVRPVLLLDFANSAHLDPRLVATRASTKTRTGPNGVMQTLPWHAQAVEHAGATGAGRGLLVERAATNLAIYSAAFDNAAWTKSSYTVSAASATAPDGTTTACKIIPAANTNGKLVYQSISASAPMVITVRAKAAGYNWLRLDFGTGSRSAYFDLANGAVGTTVGGVSASIRAIGPAGWFECSVTHASLYDGYLDLACGDSDNFANTFQGDGSSGVHVWGAQSETGGLASSYIPTTSASVTRALDRVEVKSAPFAEAVGSSELTMLMAFDYRGQHTVGRALLDLSNAAATHAVRFDIAANASTVRGEVYTASSTVASFTAAISVGRNVVAMAIAVDNVAFATNGTAVQTDSSAAMPTVTSMTLGGFNLLTDHEYGDPIELVAIYNKRVTNAELLALVNNA